MEVKIFHRLSRIDLMISKANTGTPIELAKKMKVSERCVRYYISLLKKLGAPIEFSRKRRSYHYKQNGYFCFRFNKADDDISHDTV